MDAWRAGTARRRAAAEERRQAEVQAARRLARARLAVRRQELLDRWRSMERGSPRLAEVAAKALATFLDGANPPECVPDDRLPPLHAIEWRWLIDNGLVKQTFVAAQLPVVQSGPHVYGHRGFSGLCVTPEARDVYRYLFGAGVWQEYF